MLKTGFPLTGNALRFSRLLGNLLTGKGAIAMSQGQGTIRAGKGTIRTGEGTVRAGQDF